MPTFFLRTHRHTNFLRRTQRNKRTPVRSGRLRWGILSFTVSLAATATTTNHCTLPCPAPALSPLAAVCPDLRLLLVPCGNGACMCVLFSLGESQWHHFGTSTLFPHLPSPLVFHPVLAQCASPQLGGFAGLWVGALFHQPGASVRGLFHFASWC